MLFTTAQRVCICSLLQNYKKKDNQVQVLQRKPLHFLLHSQSIDQDEHRKIITNQPSLLQPLYLTESFLTEFGFHIKFLKGEILQLAKFHDLHCSSICILFFIHLLTVRCPVLVFPIWWQYHFSSTATKIMTVQKVNFSPSASATGRLTKGRNSLGMSASIQDDPWLWGYMCELPAKASCYMDVGLWTRVAIFAQQTHYQVITPSSITLDFKAYIFYQ